jgi:ElaB/YqjD/DUF883 family membrane-anchored ribosome-binding protein
MTNTISSTRDTLIDDTDALKRDAGRIVEDVKQHASAHVEAVKASVNDTLCATGNYIKERPFQVAGVAFLLGFLFGLSRRR